MRKTAPQIPRDVFFGEAPQPAAPPPPAAESVPVASAPPEAAPRVSAPPEVSAPPPATVVAAPTVARPVEDDKVQVTIYLSPTAAKRLEGLRFHLLNEYKRQGLQVGHRRVCDRSCRRRTSPRWPSTFAIGER